MIEVFVRSSSVNAGMEVETLREMSQHAYCAPDAWQGLLKDYGTKFKGRILSSDDQEVLGKLEIIASKFHEEVKIYDISRTFDRMKAVKQGIQKTPTIIVQGKKYEGLEKISALLK
jgi:hypothetical protein